MTLAGINFALHFWPGVHARRSCTCATRGAGFVTRAAAGGAGAHRLPVRARCLRGLGLALRYALFNGVSIITTTGYATPTTTSGRSSRRS
jgi:hypothetical protein